MKHFTNCILIFILCLFYFALDKNADIFLVSAITGILFAFVILTYTYFLDKSCFTFFICCLYGIFTLVSPTATAFLPIALYCIVRQCHRNITALYLLFTLFRCMLCGNLYNLTLPNGASVYLSLYIFILCIFSVHICHFANEHEKLIEHSRQYRDDSTEINLLLKEKNKSLLTNQDYEINNATLMERNRIAREIHDNVGHMLTRAIMLTGAIKVVNKNENLCPSIDNLEECLSTAMNNIRESVHNLHNNSISLENTIKNLTADFDFCKINLIYDIEENIPNDVKYTFIAIVKEGLTNIEKHSNATAVKLTLREHPAIYQLILHDNGTNSTDFDCSPYKSESYLSVTSGIGLNNMYSRIHMLKGTIKIYTDNGFCIFISVPKNFHTI